MRYISSISVSNLDYVLRTSVNLTKENGFVSEKEKKIISHKIY